MKRGWLVGVMVGAMLAFSQAAWAGPVTLAGHDADDHGFDSIYAGLFDAILSNVTNGGSGILSLGADVGADAALWITSVASLMTTPQAVTFKNDADLSSISFSGFAILEVPSDIFDTGGGISGAENALLTARSGDVAAFVNGGGGLFGLTQGIFFPDPYGYITGAGGIGAITTLAVPPSGSLPSGANFDDVTATAAGGLLGITDTNLDGCCWHNVYTSFPSFFDVLATANTPEPADDAYNGQAAAIGGATVTITPVNPVPEPASILLFGLGGLGAGLTRRRKFMKV